MDPFSDIDPVNNLDNIEPNLEAVVDMNGEDLEMLGAKTSQASVWHPQQYFWCFWRRFCGQDTQDVICYSEWLSFVLSLSSYVEKCFTIDVVFQIKNIFFCLIPRWLAWLK